MVQFKFTLFVTNANRASFIFAAPEFTSPRAQAFEVMVFCGQCNQQTNAADT